jgi:hypothetical protein
MMVALSNRGAWPWTIKIRFSRRQQNANLGTKGSLPAPSRRAAETCLVDQEQVASRGTNARPMFNLAIDSKLRACDVVALKGRGHSLDTWRARANSKRVIQKNRNVRCGSRADMPTPISDVCFTPESCRGFRRPARPLWAKSGSRPVRGWLLGVIVDPTNVQGLLNRSL